MLVEFKDSPVFFVVKMESAYSEGMYERAEVVAGPFRGSTYHATSRAELEAAKDHEHSYYVMAWSLGEGSIVVCEWRGGELKIADAYHSRHCRTYFAPAMLRHVADYLATEVRAHTPLTPDEEIVARSI